MTSIQTNIEIIFNEKIRPQLILHGGDVEFKSYEDKIVRVKLLGSCFNCPSADETVKDVIEGTLINELGSDNIKKVVIVNDVSQDLLDMATRILNHKI